MLVSVSNQLKKLNGGLYFADLKSRVYESASKSYFVARIGNAHFFDSKKDAIKYIYNKLDNDICDGCTARVFNECN